MTADRGIQESDAMRSAAVSPAPGPAPRGSDRGAIFEINSMLYEDYGVKMFSNVVACKRSTIEKKPELCEAFVGGLMEGLKYVYLNPEKSVALHLESVKEFQGGSVANQKVIEYGQAVSTALGVVPAVRQHGVGYMDPELVATTAKTVETYMGVKNAPPIETLFTNKFVGGVKLTEAEWSEVEKRSEKYLPRKNS
jgi:hypothetical protein